jgi:hypothetical protein
MIEERNMNVSANKKYFVALQDVLQQIFWCSTDV